MVNTAAG